MFKNNLFTKLFQSAEDTIGLDIGHFSVKAARVNRSANKMMLSFGLSVIDQAGSLGVVNAIKDACSHLSVNTTSVNISVSGPKVIMRYLVLPAMQPRDLTKSLELEIEKYVPYKKEEVLLDYRVVNRLSNNQCVILLIAVERKFVDEKIKLVSDAGFKAGSINVDALSLREVFVAIMPAYKKPVAVLDVGYRLIKLLIMENNLPIFSRDIEVGEYEIAQIISKKLGVDFEQAKIWGGDPETRASDKAILIKKEVNNILSELFLSFEYCERNLGKKIEQLYVAGGGSKLWVLMESLGRFPYLKSEVLDLTQRFKVDAAQDDTFKNYAYLLPIAVSLAL